MDQYNGLDDERNDADFMTLLESMLVGSKMKYSTLIEV